MASEDASCQLREENPKETATPGNQFLTAKSRPKEVIRMKAAEKYDVVVLGSGTAGKLMAWTMAKEGRRTACR